MTKTFKAWNGDRELTREQYIQEWKDQTDTFWTLFAQYGSFIELKAFIDTVEENAGNAWDKHK
jgi:hypothetical protein